MPERSKEAPADQRCENCHWYKGKCCLPLPPLMAASTVLQHHGGSDFVAEVATCSVNADYWCVFWNF